jgi:hypothetical protein
VRLVMFIDCAAGSFTLCCALLYGTQVLGNYFWALIFGQNMILRCPAAICCKVLYQQGMPHVAWRAMLLNSTSVTFGVVNH